jgi:hypothetical protein
MLLNWKMSTNNKNQEFYDYNNFLQIDKPTAYPKIYPNLCKITRAHAMFLNLS